ncbi:NYN domain-containing protein, partial [Streptomyces sp. WAC05374]
TLRWSSDRGWVDRPGGTVGEPPETASLPTLAQLTSAEQRWADREEDITTVGGDPFEVGQVFARRWMERLPDPAHVQKLSTMYPRIPHRIDGELLRYAARFGLLAHKDDQIDEHDRYAIRAGFWREIDVRAAAEHAPVGE